MNEKTILGELEERIHVCISTIAIKFSINFERNNDHSLVKKNKAQ